MQDDHLGAYAATCAYFLMISFVPFLLILIAIAAETGTGVSDMTDWIVHLVPTGIKDYIGSIISELSSRSNSFVPISILILVWSAAKAFHALANGLNVISRVEETRGWFFLRIRSMIFVTVLTVGLACTLTASIYGSSITEKIMKTFPEVSDVLTFLLQTRSIYQYLGLVLVFLAMYKFLPNCHYTFRSQLPGALLVSTVWSFFSYLMALYYSNNMNFSNLYGSLTGIVLAMMWLYSCFFFLLFGAELNRVIIEDPDGNIIVSTVEVLRDANVRRKQKIMDELDEYSVWKPIRDEGEELKSRQPDDIVIPWADEPGNDPLRS